MNDSTKTIIAIAVLFGAVFSVAIPLSFYQREVMLVEGQVTDMFEHLVSHDHMAYSIELNDTEWYEVDWQSWAGISNNTHVYLFKTRGSPYWSVDISSLYGLI